MLDTQRLRRLLERHWDQVLEMEERAELEDMLRASSQARDLFWQHAMWQAAMRAWGESEWGRRDPSSDPQAVSYPRDFGTPSLSGPPARPPVARAAIWAAVFVSTATLCGAVWWAAPAWAPRIDDVIADAVLLRHIAVITALEEPVWRGPAFALGQGLPACLLAIESGSIEITFASGARVLLRGPAEFGVLSPLRGELFRGDLAARVPPGAEGFVVDTPSVEVVDLGTAFGVRVGDDGTADVRVFEGAVEARAENSSAEDNPFVRLEQDMARRFLPQGGVMIDSPASSEQFPVLMPDAPDRPVTSGAIELLRSPPPSLVCLQSDDFIVMFLERTATTVSPGCLVDIVAPGLYGNGSRHPPQPLGRRVRVESYLLHCDALPRPHPERPRDKRGAEMRLEGAVTFARPVVAVLHQRKSLDASDAVLGKGVEYYPSRGDPFRGAEPFDSDKIVLSPDRRSVSVSLLVRAQKGRDQIRVLVEAE